jgi:hypothetical protein
LETTQTVASPQTVAWNSWQFPENLSKKPFKSLSFNVLFQAKSTKKYISGKKTSTNDQCPKIQPILTGVPPRGRSTHL